MKGRFLDKQMADQWNITLGARYTYDTKGMTYTTTSNSVPTTFCNQSAPA